MLLEEYRPVSKLRVKRDSRKLPSQSVIDFHTHWGRLLRSGAALDETVALARDNGIISVVNLDGGEGETLRLTLERTSGFPGFFHTFGNVDPSCVDEAGFESYVHKTLSESKALGMSGIKYFKSLGLGIKDSAGAYIRPDDERLRCIWQSAAELDLPVLYHIADPIAFFDPMGPQNERYEELCENPTWSFSGPEHPSFAQMMDMQQSLIESNPRTTFIIPHVGSCAEDLAFVASMLDRFSNMHIDIAARVAELGRQPYTARDFFIKYADRVLYGSDMLCKQPYHYQPEFRFLETLDEYFDYYEGEGVPPQGRWQIYGIGLPDDVLKKIYTQNAEKLLKLK